jgi:hypothetical protein
MLKPDLFDRNSNSSLLFDAFMNNTVRSLTEFLELVVLLLYDFWRIHLDVLGVFFVVVFQTTAHFSVLFVSQLVDGLGMLFSSHHVYIFIADHSV